jgi:hypothetical protein
VQGMSNRPLFQSSVRGNCYEQTESHRKRPDAAGLCVLSYGA